MSLRLRDLESCFEGVIPSIVATVASDGTPNISYLSHVVMVDDDHVALSNQFFSKTAANVRANPQATLILVDPRDGAQFRLGLVFEDSVDSGPLFDKVASQLRASSAQIGMAGVMRLRGLDIYAARSIDAVPSVNPAPPASGENAPRLAALTALTEAIADQVEVETIIETALAGIEARFGYKNALVLVHDKSRGVLTTLGSRGYQPTGIGSEVPLGEGLIGSAASERRIIKISDMSRIQRFGAAVRNSLADENRTRAIALPGVAGIMSQIGIPMMAFGDLYGVLFVESSERLAFTAEDEHILAILGRTVAAALLFGETLARDSQPAGPEQTAAGPTERPFRVVHHAFDDSVFIENEYIIKGVPGRLLMFMLDTYGKERRCDFTNREIRLAESLRLPEFKDNLETRLLLLRRRLEEKSSLVRLVRTGRGRIRLELRGEPVLAKQGT